MAISEERRKRKSADNLERLTTQLERAMQTLARSSGDMVSVIDSSTKISEALEKAQKVINDAVASRRTEEGRINAMNRALSKLTEGMDDVTGELFETVVRLQKKRSELERIHSQTMEKTGRYLERAMGIMQDMEHGLSGADIIAAQEELEKLLGDLNSDIKILPAELQKELKEVKSYTGKAPQQIIDILQRAQRKNPQLDALKDEIDDLIDELEENSKAVRESKKAFSLSRTYQRVKQKISDSGPMKAMKWIKGLVKGFMGLGIVSKLIQMGEAAVDARAAVEAFRVETGRSTSYFTKHLAGSSLSFDNTMSLMESLAETGIHYTAAEFKDLSKQMLLYSGAFGESTSGLYVSLEEIAESMHYTARRVRDTIPRLVPEFAGLAAATHVSTRAILDFSKHVAASMGDFKKVISPQQMQKLQEATNFLFAKLTTGKNALTAKQASYVTQQIHGAFEQALQGNTNQLVLLGGRKALEDFNRGDFDKVIKDILERSTQLFRNIKEAYERGSVLERQKMLQQTGVDIRAMASAERAYKSSPLSPEEFEKTKSAAQKIAEQQTITEARRQMNIAKNSGLATALDKLNEPLDKIGTKLDHLGDRLTTAIIGSDSTPLVAYTKEIANVAHEILDYLQNDSSSIVGGGYGSKRFEEGYKQYAQKSNEIKGEVNSAPIRGGGYALFDRITSLFSNKKASETTRGVHIPEKPQPTPIVNIPERPQSTVVKVESPMTNPTTIHTIETKTTERIVEQPTTHGSDVLIERLIEINKQSVGVLSNIDKKLTPQTFTPKYAESTKTSTPPR